MGDWWIGFVVAAGAVLVLVALGLMARRIRRWGSAGPALGAAMAVVDQAAHVTAYDAYVEMQAQSERTVELASPEDV